MSDEAKKVNDFSFTKAVRAAYLHVITPEQFKKNGVAKGDPKYQGTFVCEPDNEDLKRLKAEVIKMLQEKEPGKKLVTRPLTMEELNSGSAVTVQVPWSDGNKEADRLKAKGKDGEIFRGKTLLKSSSKFQPTLAAIVNKAFVEFATPEAKAAAGKYFYSGAWLVPTFGLHWYKGDENKPNGVSLYIDGAMFWKDDARLGGKQRSAAEMFKGIVGNISQEDPTGGAAAGDELEDL